MWHTRSAQDILSELNSNSQTGLEPGEIARRLEKYGPNELVEQGSKSPWSILKEQFMETMVIVLIIAAIISGYLGEYKDAGAILAIVVVNGLLGFRQEYQAEKAMAALKKLAVPNVRVRRGRHVLEVPASTLVPGDIVLLEAGNLVPADCRLVEGMNLRCQEATLTGESEPVSKDATLQLAQETPLVERRNMLYMGTIVSYGRGVAVVTATGMDTELGNIAELMQSAQQEATPLQVRLAQLGKGLALAAFAIVVVVFTLGVLRGEPVKDMFLTAISIAVAAIPEGLPAVVTIALALGARRMLGRKALIRKLPAVEALGSVTVICSDKTGTLTENRMTVTVLDVAEHRIDFTEELVKGYAGQTLRPCQDPFPDEDEQQYLAENPAMTLLLATGALCNDALLECDERVPASFHIVGDPTEGALVVAAARVGLVKESLEKSFPRVAELPFDAERKRMTTVHLMPHIEAEVPETYRPIWDWQGWGDGITHMAFTKGAVDGLLDLVDRVWVDNHFESIDPTWRERIELANQRMAESGMRVLGLACRAADPAEVAHPNGDLESKMIFIGLAGMIDPARPEVEAAVQTCQIAGIRPMMITGDHPLTARYIADELGFDTRGGVITGNELESLSDEQLEDKVEKVSVYARVTPEHKLRIVKALQKRGHIAAMTGDGVNDAPALKKADIGVAMGITGTDVSKEASDMVLIDDNFTTIVAAVEEGRVIYDNIRKFIKYTLSSNFGEILVMLLAPFFGMSMPLLPLQILWINLVTDGLPGLALGVERGERDTMRRPPYPPQENIFARGVGRDIIWVGFVMGLLSLAVGYWYWQQGREVWQTMLFTTLTLAEMGYVMAIRSNRDSLLKVGVFSNPAMLAAVGLTFILQLGVIYLPFMQNLFRTQSLSLVDLIVSGSVGLTLLLLVEVQKWFARRFVSAS